MKGVHGRELIQFCQLLPVPQRDRIFLHDIPDGFRGGQYTDNGTDQNHLSRFCVLNKADIVKLFCDKIGNGLFSGNQVGQMRCGKVKREAGVRQDQLQVSVLIIVYWEIGAVV